MTSVRSFTAALLLIAGVASAQDLTHPTRMHLAESDFTRPDPADYQLSLENGLTAYIARADQVPLVTMSAFIRAGLASDETQGAAEALLDALQNGGPAHTTPAGFKRALHLMAADYAVDMHDEWTEVTLNVPTEDLDEALTIFAGLLRSPAIAKEALSNAAKRATPESADLAGESGPALYEGSLAAAVLRFYDVLYADHPFGVRPTAADFGKLDLDDVRAFHAEFFVPANMTLAIAGDIDPSAMQTRIVELFGDVSFDEPPSPRRMPPIGAMRLAQHTYPVDKLQSWLVFGHELPEVPVEDQAALEVMNYILAGGHLYTRMTVETRYRYGYTNDASGFLEDRWFGPGSYTFRSYSRPEVILTIYQNMMAEIARIRTDEVSDEDLFIAKGALTDGEFQVRYLDGYAISREFAIERLRYGNHSRSASYVDRIRAVTAEDVMRAANRYIKPERMQIILVGEPADLTD